MKITKKEYEGFKKAYFRGITANDSFNLEYYGITEKRYLEIKRKAQDIVGYIGSLRDVSFKKLQTY